MGWRQAPSHWPQPAGPIPSTQVMTHHACEAASSCTGVGAGAGSRKWSASAFSHLSGWIGAAWLCGLLSPWLGVPACRLLEGEEGEGEMTEKKLFHSQTRPAHPWPGVPACQAVGRGRGRTEGGRTEKNRTVPFPNQANFLPAKARS